jgi:tRNA-2-methylthio-N6-dimethylallyladenosine synthase
MAERLKEKLFEQQVVDIVCGPDAYRDLPRLLAKTELGQSGANVMCFQVIFIVRLNYH